MLVLPVLAQAPQADQLDSMAWFVSKGRVQLCNDAKAVEKSESSYLWYQLGCGLCVWDVRALEWPELGVDDERKVEHEVIERLPLPQKLYIHHVSHFFEQQQNQYELELARGNRYI